MNFSKLNNVSDYSIEAASELAISAIIALTSVLGFFSLNNMPMPI